MIYLYIKDGPNGHLLFLPNLHILYNLSNIPLNTLSTIPLSVVALFSYLTMHFIGFNFDKNLVKEFSIIGSLSINTFYKANLFYFPFSYND